MSSSLGNHIGRSSRHDDVLVGAAQLLRFSRRPRRAASSTGASVYGSFEPAASGGGSRRADSSAPVIYSLGRHATTVVAESLRGSRDFLPATVSSSRYHLQVSPPLRSAHTFRHTVGRALPELWPSHDLLPPHRRTRTA